MFLSQSLGPGCRDNCSDNDLYTVNFPDRFFIAPPFPRSPRARARESSSRVFTVRAETPRAQAYSRKKPRQYLPERADDFSYVPARHPHDFAGLSFQACREQIGHLKTGKKGITSPGVGSLNGSARTRRYLNLL